MPIIAKEPDGGSNFPPAPADVHRGICVDVIDLGQVDQTYAGNTRKVHKIRLAWELDAYDEENNRRFMVWKKYTNSLHAEANLRKDLKSWRGRDFTEAELEGFDVESVIGAECRLNVIHKDFDGKTKVLVDSVLPPDKKAKDKLKPSGEYVRMIDRPEEDASTRQNGKNPSSEEAEAETAISNDDLPF